MEREEETNGCVRSFCKAFDVNIGGGTRDDSLQLI